MRFGVFLRDDSLFFIYLTFCSLLYGNEFVADWKDFMNGEIAPGVFFSTLIINWGKGWNLEKIDEYQDLTRISGLVYMNPVYGLELTTYPLFITLFGVWINFDVWIKIFFLIHYKCNIKYLSILVNIALGENVSHKILWGDIIYKTHLGDKRYKTILELQR